MFGRQKEEDALITYASDREDSDDEDPDFAAYTPRLDLEEVQAARTSKASPFNPIRDWSDDDECRSYEANQPILAKPISYAFPTGGSAGSAARAGAQQPGPSQPRAKVGKKPQAKKTVGRKKGPPQMPKGPLSGTRVMAAVTA